MTFDWESTEENGKETEPKSLVNSDVDMTITMSVAIARTHTHTQFSTYEIMPRNQFVRDCNFGWISRAPFRQDIHVF